jgi:hypothetical protein
MTTTAFPIRYYVPSGRIAWHAPLKLAVYGGLGAAVLAAVYALVIRYNPLVYFSFIATLLFGACLGLAAASACEAGLSRSRPFNAFAGLALALFGLWVHWLLWTWLSYEDGFESARRLALSGPAGWLDFFSFTAEHRQVAIGRLGSRGAAETPGFMLWTWALEALAVSVVAVFSACVTLNAKPFSEPRRQWARTDWEGELPSDFAGAVDKAQVERRIAEQGVDWLAGLAEAGAGGDASAPVMLKLSCVSAPDDPACAFLSLAAVTRRGEKRKTTTSLVESLHVEAGAYARLVARLPAQPRTQDGA